MAEVAIYVGILCNVTFILTLERTDGHCLVSERCYKVQLVTNSSTVHQRGNSFFRDALACLKTTRRHRPGENNLKLYLPDVI